MIDLERKLSTVLLVDDSEADNYLHREVIEESGCVDRVCDVESAQDALELLQGGLRPDLILLDVNMPRMDGWKFLEAYAALESVPDAVVIVMLTTADDPTLIKRASDQGIGFQNKPLTETVLEGILSQHFADRR